MGCTARSAETDYQLCSRRRPRVRARAGVRNTGGRAGECVSGRRLVVLVGSRGDVGDGGSGIGG